jgi:hypothetical protein
MKSGLKSGNTCYHSTQHLLFSRLFSNDLKIKIYKTVSWPIGLCGCESRSLILSGEHGLKVFENRVLRKYLKLRRADGRKLENVV